MKKTSCLISSELFYKEERTQCNVIKSRSIELDSERKGPRQNVNKGWNYCLVISYIYLFVCLFVGSFL